MTQVQAISQYEDKTLKSEEQVLDNETRETVVKALVEQGLPRAFSPSNYINRIAETYGISTRDARTCLKEAVSILEDAAKEKVQEQDDEKLYAQSGYFYPQAATNPAKAEEKDGMDSLVAFGNYQRLAFGLY
ncbi:hypothetical protein IJ531_07315 [bacterium]|nr:hypothetical protein [bacterium]